MGIGQPVQPLDQLLQSLVDRGQGHHHDQKKDDIRGYFNCRPGRFFSTENGDYYKFEEDKTQDSSCNRRDEPAGHNLPHLMPVDSIQTSGRYTETGNCSDD